MTSSTREHQNGSYGHLKPRRLASLFMLLLIAGAVGCEKETSPVSGASAQSKGNYAQPSVSPSDSQIAPTTPVTLALNWFPEAEHGGFYAALVHKYFADEGLDVTIRPGGPGVPVLPDVASGRVEFAVDNADKLLLLRAQQAEVVAVMAPIQDSPRCIMVHKSEGITKLEELANRTPFKLAMNAGQPFAQFLMKKIDLEKATVVAYPGNVVEFLAESKYGQQAYSFSEPFDAERQGSDPVCLMLSEIGFNTYTSLLVTNADTIAKRPELVEKMTRASIQGWKKYLADPDETNKHIHEQNPAMSLDVLAFGVKTLKPLCLPKDFHEERLGEMNAERWNTLAAQMIQAGSLKADFGKAEDAYSVRFVKSEK